MYQGVVVNPFARKNRGMPAGRSAAPGRIIGPWGKCMKPVPSTTCALSAGWRLVDDAKTAL
jgi:hypothetical protein